MPEEEKSYLSEVEALLKGKFSKDKKHQQKTPGDARTVAAPARMDQLVLPDSERPKMPLTKDKYLVKDNPYEVQWEREVRKFLVKLSPRHEHRITASMIYEWATGISVKDLVEQGGSTTDLKRINRILRFYFGQPYMTYICGKKVPKAYKVKGGYYITKHRPMTLTLWTEKAEGTLWP